MTGGHSLPALEAAHIIPYGTDSAGHTLENGLLLRADVHRLFDRGYVTITPEYTFKVSRRLREDYDNGKVYYDLEDRKIWTPKAPYPKPDPERLERHATEAVHYTPLTLPTHLRVSMWVSTLSLNHQYHILSTTISHHLALDRAYI